MDFMKIEKQGDWMIMTIDELIADFQALIDASVPPEVDFNLDLDKTLLVQSEDKVVSPLPLADPPDQILDLTEQSE